MLYCNNKQQQQSTEKHSKHRPHMAIYLPYQSFNNNIILQEEESLDDGDATVFSFSSNASTVRICNISAERRREVSHWCWLIRIGSLCVFGTRSHLQYLYRGIPFTKFIQCCSFIGRILNISLHSLVIAFAQT